MAYDTALADRVQAIIGDRPEVSQRRMFGGLAWLVNGHMAVVVRAAGGLMVRVDPAEHDTPLAEEGADTMVMRGRPMRGWITVDPEVCASKARLVEWVRRGLAYAATLPPK